MNQKLSRESSKRRKSTLIAFIASMYRAVLGGYARVRSTWVKEEKEEVLKRKYECACI